MSKARVVVDWARIYGSYGLGKETLSQLSAFRLRSSNAALAATALQTQAASLELDFAHYRSVLKNQAVVDEIEKAVKAFKPAEVNLDETLKAIEVFEAKALEGTQATTSKISSSLTTLTSALSDIESARSVRELTVADVLKAEPRIEGAIENVTYNGGWRFPKGYKEKFGDMSWL